MSIPIIDQLRPLGNFPAVDASDVQAGNQRLSTVLSNTPTTTYVDAVVENKVDKVDGKGLSTNDYTNAEKNKLSGIEANANNYVHPTTAGYKHIPSGGSAGKILGWKANGEAQWVDDQNTQYSDATTTTHGLMSAADKSKLSGIEAQATRTVVDSALSTTSTNPVQNKVVKTALDAQNSSLVNGLATKADASTVSSLSSQVSTNTTNIDTQTARIDAIVALPSGSTQGDAELMDIRVKADGLTASSAGAAVREQMVRINDNINSLTDESYNYDKMTYTNDTSLSTSSASGRYAIFLTERKFVESIRPFFKTAASNVTVQYRFVTSSTNFESGSIVELGAIQSVTGDTSDIEIPINDYLDHKKGVIIYCSNLIKYCLTNGADLSTAHIMAVHNGMDNIISSYVDDYFEQYCFAGVIKTKEPVSKFVEKTRQYERQDVTFKNNNDLLSTGIGAVYALWFEEDTYVKSIKPYYVESTGNVKYRFIYDASENQSGFAHDCKVSFGEEFTCYVGDTIPINKVLNKHRGLIINPSETRIKHVKTTKTAISTAKIMSIYGTSSGNYCHEMFPQFCFAGDFVIDMYAEKKLAVTNYLNSKKIMAVGDSMVAGHSLSTNQTWLYKIGERNNMTTDNRGENGAYLTNRMHGSLDNSVYKKVCDTTSDRYISDNDMQSYDYILVYAGTNDIRVEATIGNENSVDPTEFNGALNLICQGLQTRAPQAHIAFITPYLREGLETRCQTYVNAIKSICAKYSIPVFDNAKDGSICWSSSAIKSTLTLDDTYHLNEKGMEFVSYKYEHFIRGI